LKIYIKINQLQIVLKNNEEVKLLEKTSTSPVIMSQFQNISKFVHRCMDM